MTEFTRRVFEQTDTAACRRGSIVSQCGRNGLRGVVGTESAVGTVRFEPPKSVIYHESPGDSLHRRFGLSAWPETRAPSRFTSLTIAPDGNVWLWPTHDRVPGPDLEVVIVSVPNGEVMMDTVPAFPLVFSGDGSYYGVTTDTLFVQRIVRVRQTPLDR